MHDFSRRLQRLTDDGLDFVIVGGYAALTHGSSLITRGLDICAVLTIENVEKLRRALSEWSPKHRMTTQRLSFLHHPVPGTQLEKLYLETDVGVIDILSSILGVGDFERLRAKAEKLEVENRTYRVISLDDLIAAKLAVGREKDLLAVKELRATAAKRQPQEG
ncbi:MAG: nucleotidyltransferase [Opitutaceae bacterium]